MTIAIVGNLSDGAVLGADSAITITGRAELPSGVTEGVLKVYNDAEKIFPLSNLPVGIISYGVAYMGKRTIESYIREFEVEQAKLQHDLKKDSVQDIAESLREFFLRKYEEIFRPVLEAQLKLRYDEIPAAKKPLLGLVLAGYSPGEALSEVWEVHVPLHTKKEDLRCVRAKGQFGTNWFGQYFAISRMIKGYDPPLLDAVAGFFVGRFGLKWDPAVEAELGKVIAQHEYRIPFDGMPLLEGIEHVRFLLDTVIHQHKYVIGAPVCGGSTRVAAVTPRGFSFVGPKSDRPSN